MTTSVVINELHTAPLVEPPVPLTTGELPKEISTLVGQAEHLTVASFNVENLDIQVEDPARTDLADRAVDDGVDDDIGSGKLAAIAQQIVGHLNSPDIIALQEVQDNDGAEISDIVSASATFEALIEAIAAAGGPRYAYIDTPGLVPAYLDSQGRVISPVGGDPGGNIRNGFLYNPQRVHLVDGSVQPLTDPADQALNPDNPFYRNPIPLTATFRFNNQDVTVINTHLSSSTDPSRSDASLPSASEIPTGQDIPGIDRQQTPPTQTEAIARAVDSLLATDAQAHVVVLGDFSESGLTSPLDAFTPLTHLTETASDGWTPDATPQPPDLIWVSDALVANAEVDIVQVNRGFTDAASDHDPLLARLDFSLNPILGTLQRDLLTGTDQADLIVGLDGADVLNGGAGNDRLIGGGGRDQLTGGAGRDQFVFQQVSDRTDQILDFEVDQDQIVLTELLDSLGYTGSDPFADGYVSINPVGTLGSILLVYPNGPGSSQPPEAMAFLLGVEAASLTPRHFVI